MPGNVEFDGACAFCDLSSGEWGWCLHCERIYPAVRWRSVGWRCPGPGCDGGPEDAYPFPPTPGCANCVPPLDYRPTDLAEGQLFALWPPPTPLHRQLLANPVAWIRRMAEKANSEGG